MTDQTQNDDEKWLRELRGEASGSDSTDAKTVGHIRSALIRHMRSVDATVPAPPADAALETLRRIGSQEKTTNRFRIFVKGVFAAPGRLIVVLATPQSAGVMASIILLLGVTSSYQMSQLNDAREEIAIYSQRGHPLPTQMLEGVNDSAISTESLRHVAEPQVLTLSTPNAAGLRQNILEAAIAAGLSSKVIVKNETVTLLIGPLVPNDRAQITLKALLGLSSDMNGYLRVLIVQTHEKGNNHS